MKKLNLTFITIAYNEEGAIRKTVEEVLSFLKKHNFSAPILILNDGSTDRTKEIADKLCEEYENVSAFHHPKNVGQFKNIRKGIELVQTTYFTIVPGDAQIDISAFEMYLPMLGKYDIIFGFPNNEFEARGRKRTVLSHTWRLFILGLYGISVTYLAGVVIAPTELSRRMPVFSDGFLGWYELAVRMVLSGATYIQLPFTIRERQSGVGRAYNPVRNILDLLRMLKVWWRIKGPGFFREGPDYNLIRQIYTDYTKKITFPVDTKKDFQ